MKQSTRPQLQLRPPGTVRPLLHCVYCTGVVDVVDVLATAVVVKVLVLVDVDVVRLLALKHARPNMLLPNGSRSAKAEQSAWQLPSARYCELLHSEQMESAGPVVPGGTPQAKQLLLHVHCRPSGKRPAKHDSKARVLVVDVEDVDEVVPIVVVEAAVDAAVLVVVLVGS